MELNSLFERAGKAELGCQIVGLSGKGVGGEMLRPTGPVHGVSLVGWVRLLTVGALAEGSTGVPRSSGTFGQVGARRGKSVGCLGPQTFSVPEGLMKGPEAFSFACTLFSPGTRNLARMPLL